jgi:hypothetical protein
MSLMPNARDAEVPIEKIVNYLLSVTHPIGSKKSAFFKLFGFSAQFPDVLRLALVAHAQANQVGTVSINQYGTKYEITGPLATPSGRTPQVSTIWMVTGNSAPRLVTAVPVKAKTP